MRSISSTAHQRIQTSENFWVNSLLAVSGGFQDAYTYFLRGEVFSNAQTGNVVLMSQSAIQGNWMECLRYLFPILSFAFGVWTAVLVEKSFDEKSRLHWRQGVLLLEIAVLFLVGWLPQSCNQLATMLVSFVCAMQVQSFRRFEGGQYASTMCIGNLRCATENWAIYCQNKNPEALHRSAQYSGIILSFALGAGLGGWVSQRDEEKWIWISCLLLALACVRMCRPWTNTRKETF